MIIKADDNDDASDCRDFDGDLFFVGGVLAAALGCLAMRIAFLHPTYWPEVRRGSERLVHDLAVGLVGRGHEVTLLTSHPGRTAITEEEGVRIIRSRRPPRVPPMHWYEDYVVNVPANVWRLSRGGFDLAHAFFPADGWAATLARKHAGGPPFVFSLHGIPIREYLVQRRYRLQQLQRCVGAAAAATVLSEAAAEPTRRYLLREPLILGGGIRIEDFAIERRRTDKPTLVCAASLRDPRKRAGILFEAFERLRDRRPDARLLLVRTSDPHAPAQKLPDPPVGASWVDVEETSDLAQLYATAWASVLPSVQEAFGLVLAESLAAGTPVVAARSGGCPEIVNDSAIGRLFEPDSPDDLARAMGEVLDLSRSEHTAAACRSHATRFDIAPVLDRCEQIYRRVLDRSTVTPQAEQPGSGSTPPSLR